MMFSGCVRTVGTHVPNPRTPPRPLKVRSLLGPTWPWAPWLKDWHGSTMKSPWSPGFFEEQFWLVVSTPLKNWDDELPNIWKNIKCSKTPTRIQTNSPFPDCRNTPKTSLDFLGRFHQEETLGCPDGRRNTPLLPWTRLSVGNGQTREAWNGGRTFQANIQGWETLWRYCIQKFST